MNQTTTVRARVNPVLKDNVEMVLGRLGITLSEAIKMYMYQIVLQRGIPFDLQVPSDETLQTFAETDKGIGLTKHDSVDDMFKKLGV